MWLHNLLPMLLYTPAVNPPQGAVTALILLISYLLIKHGPLQEASTGLSIHNEYQSKGTPALRSTL